MPNSNSESKQLNEASSQNTGRASVGLSSDLRSVARAGADPVVVEGEAPMCKINGIADGHFYYSEGLPIRPAS